MNIKVLLASTVAVALLGLGMLVGSAVGTGQAFAQTPPASQTAPTSPGSAQATITQQQAEQAALTAAPGNTVDHTRLMTKNGASVYDVDFTNGGGVDVNAQTGAVVATQAAGTDQGWHGGSGGPDQAALLAQAKVTQAQAEKAALAASPGNTVDHSRLGSNNGTVFWDIDFANGGGVNVNAVTGAIMATEAAGTDHGGFNGGGSDGGR